MNAVSVPRLKREFWVCACFLQWWDNKPKVCTYFSGNAREILWLASRALEEPNTVVHFKFVHSDIYRAINREACKKVMCKSFNNKHRIYQGSTHYCIARKLKTWVINLNLAVCVCPKRTRETSASCLMGKSRTSAKSLFRSTRSAWRVLASIFEHASNIRLSNKYL